MAMYAIRPTTHSAGDQSAISHVCGDDVVRVEIDRRRPETSEIRRCFEGPANHHQGIRVLQRRWTEGGRDRHLSWKQPERRPEVGVPVVRRIIPNDNYPVAGRERVSNVNQALLKAVA